MTGSAKQSIEPRPSLRAKRSNPSCRAVIASEAKQSISPRKERMDCFAPLAMTWSSRHVFTASPRDAPEPSTQSVVAGLDPAIHLLWRLMDARIKPGHDEVWLARHLNP